MKPHLLPMHYRLGRLLGMRPEDVKRFYWEAAKRAAEGPQPAVVAGTGAEVLAIVALVSSAISVGLTIVAQFFRPSDAAPGRLKPVAREGKTISDGRRYAPRDGFDALQDVAPIGERMPIVFALRETIDGVTYGGIRVNTPLLWSQIQTVKGRQLLRAIFLISDGRVGEIDPNGFALGNNLLNAYNLGPGTELGASYVAYARLNGGRIQSGNRVAGRQASLDPGNAQPQGGSDVFQVRSIGNEFASDFCSVIRPGTNTVFGVHSPIGNNLGYRVNPVIKPKYQAQLVPDGDDGDSKVKCQVDEVAAAQRRKAKAFFSTRSALTGISGSSSVVGSVLTYVLDKTSDVETDFGRALDPGAWSVNVEVERISGSGTTRVNYENDSSSSSVSIGDDLPSINQNALKDGIQWLSGNTVVPNPVVTIDNISTTKIELSTRLQYDASGLTDLQKQSLLYTRFKLTFVNSAVDNDDEPSVYYRVGTREFNRVPVNYSIDFQDEEFSLSYGTKSTTYEVQSVVASRQTVTVKLSKSKLVSELAADVASTIAGKQEQWDDAIQLGALYKIGTALAVCTARQPEGEVFYSEAGFEEPSQQDPRPGQSITAQFTIVRPGIVGPFTSLADLRVAANEDEQPARYVGTNAPHVLRIDIANVTTTRPTRLIEIGVRSNLGIRINGLCNFRDTISYGEADNRACLDYKGDKVSPGGTLKQYIYTSGSVTTSQMRYSFFRIRVRPSGSSDEWTQFQECFCFRGISQQNQFNTIRIQFPSIDQWEIELEPLSGWEIRSGNATGTFVLIDGKRESESKLITRTRSGVQVTVYGIAGTAADIGVGPSTEPFRLPAVRKSRSQGFGDLGYGYTDDDGDQRTQFVDVFGALAETFVFSEVASTAENGPEHEIVFVNEIVQNSTVPLYPNMAISGLNILPGNTFQQLGQHSVYVNAGYRDCRRLRENLSTGASHLFPDIALELLTNPIYGDGDEVSDDQIDFDGFKEAAEWCYANRYFCDIGYTPQNIMEWIAQTAEQHLLLFFEVDGKFTLKPLFPYVPGNYTNWSQKVDIKGVFGLLQMKSFSFAAVDEQERKPIQASGKWREERQQTAITNPGIFPNEREVLLRETSPNGSESDPIVSFDLSDFATNEKHLIDYLKFKARSRRLSTHGCTVELTQDSLLAPLRPGDYVQIPVEMTFYSEFRTGIVREDGVLVATEEIAAGTYPALVWNGSIESNVEESTIAVDASGNASPRGIIFSIKDSSSDLKTYRILNITPSENAGFTLELLESPIDSAGRLILSQNWGGTVSDSDWEIKK